MSLQDMETAIMNVVMVVGTALISVTIVGVGIVIGHLICRAFQWVKTRTNDFFDFL